MDVVVRYVFTGDPSLALLGEGSYGKVYKAKDRLTGNSVAIKQIALEKLSVREEELIRQEIELCYALQEDFHKSIIRVVDVFEDDDTTINLVMDFFDGKSLYQWMKKDLKSDRNKEKVIQQVFKDMCEAVAFVQSRGIVHRDIKLDNFMIQVHPITK